MNSTGTSVITLDRVLCPFTSKMYFCVYPIASRNHKYLGVEAREVKVLMIMFIRQVKLSQPDIMMLYSEASRK